MQIQPGMAPLRLLDLRNVLDATVDAAVTGLQGLAASLPQQSDAEKCVAADRGTALTRLVGSTPYPPARVVPRAATAWLVCAGLCRPACHALHALHTGSGRCCATCTRRGSGCCACTWWRPGAARPMRWPMSAACRTCACAMATRCAMPLISSRTCTASSAACRRVMVFNCLWTAC